MDVVHLDVELVLEITTMALAQNGQGSARVRDFGLLESAVHRPRGSSFGDEHYPDLFEKAAALMHSLARNHVFIDGNKRAAWNCAATFLEVNGMPLRDPVDADRAERFVLDVCTGRLEDVARIAAELRTFHEVS
ncbi:type II toxin-antitoxin system death-on-curing family toxin [Nocardiopsis sp. CT-R113]|uniref:Type II toxin-antitoxin system death-on-curing family toxin n=1 Tax=Nocardiopsis codii TaxID=3065942 RepID=A0ABU7K106_9ACTN|nr:type II toxin-antitoxin system death-on-curing family toxin [Nocardiopsis sp. CT-R113]MEE2035940.1 type II toxin-antitoxin system death-on-curing family toxin [Nocardiopsis sp. CT-R113]